jgi:class 3 adenylate cyclase/CHASE2 domain-containing sensor protein
LWRSGFFVCFQDVKLKPVTLVPGWIAFGIIVFVWLFRWRQPHFLDGLEHMTYDMRVREAAKFSPRATTNLGFVFINDESVTKVWDGSLGYHFGLFWPRMVYGGLVQELKAQGAKAVAFDILLGELREDHPLVRMADGSDSPTSDEFFAIQMQQASNVILAATEKIEPPPLFVDSALALGDVVTEPVGVLRRAKAFRTYRRWHPVFLRAAAKPDLGVDLDKARIENGQLVFPRHQAGIEDIKVPLDKDGNVDLGDDVPPGTPRKAKPFIEQRVWHMGIVLAAQELKLDLSRPEVDLPGGRIVLSGQGGVVRTIPIDEEGCFYIDWCLPPGNQRLTQESIQDVLSQYQRRLKGQTNELEARWAGKLVVVGSSATGRNLSDVGATPLDEHTLLASEHWNVANSIITGRFVRRAPLWVDLALIGLLGIAAALLTWKLRVLLASVLVTLLILAYILFGVVLYVQTRYWIPLVLPVVGAALMTHVSLITWRVVFEQAERRRVRTIFSKVVSPKIVQELLAAETLSLGGARREITVLFADVRGFTAFTDLSQERVKEYVRKNNLTGASAEDCYDETARETLATVNLYLGLIADVVKKHDGTLDKFIGDCVMAFWGAPTPNSKHALACVRAAIDAQQVMYELNQQRSTENNKRQLENMTRKATGLPEKPMLPILLLGTGINTGMATAGLMGSAQEERNYTVFGGEVNLASRLESASGRGRIFIGTTTYQHLLRDDPTLAATCIELPDQKLKGISAAVKVYEVPWRPPGAMPFDEEFSSTAPSEGTTFTGFVQRSGT